MPNRSGFQDLVDIVKEGFTLQDASAACRDLHQKLTFKGKKAFERLLQECLLLDLTALLGVN
jgi:hypothetical protein